MEESLDRDSLLFHALQAFCDGLNSITAEIGMEVGQVHGGYVNAASVFRWMSYRTHRAAAQFYDAWQDFSPQVIWGAAVRQIAQQVHTLLRRLQVDIVFPLTGACVLPKTEEGEALAKKEIQDCLPRVKKIMEDLRPIMAREELQDAQPTYPCTVQLPEERLGRNSMPVAILELDIQKYGAMAELLRSRITCEADPVQAVFWLNARIRTFIRQALAAVQAEEDCFLESKGDGAYLVFSSVDLAHRFADHIHEQTGKYNTHRPETVQFHLRIGIAYGRVIIRPMLTSSNVILGFGMGGYPLIHSVRIEARCPVDGVALTADAYDRLAEEYQRRYAGPHTVSGKGTEQYAAYVWDRKQPGAPPALPAS